MATRARAKYGQLVKDAVGSSNENLQRQARLARLRKVEREGSKIFTTRKSERGVSSEHTMTPRPPENR